MTRVLFVCMGNICRSPAGENVFRHLVKQAGMQHAISCDSAGTISYHTGNGPDPRMSDTLRRRQIPVTGAARKITPSDLQEYDLILTMDDQNYHYVCALDPEALHHDKIHKFVHYCHTHNDLEVPDPYYGGQNGFDYVADMMEDGCHHLLQHLVETIPQ